ncbi:MAG: homoserine dehydrogenase [Lachnospiraceae bacterium]|nr:homoserine dehydrogenase [Lachnospiraceae bacterium]
MVYAAILGYGTVGSGVAHVLSENSEMIAWKAGEEVSVKYILDLRDFPQDPNADKVVHDFHIILEDPQVSVICETMGGLEPAYTFSKQALLAGKSVCTSNKELVAAHGPELLRLAREHNCNYLFEASVGGGIPIIRPMNYSLTAEVIDGITGILNGTTNYILTRMKQDGADFETVLKEAQEKGYAERNPEADVEGHDACRKIAILSSLMLGKTVRYEDIYTEGITAITSADFLYAKKLNRTVKLLAMSKLQEAGCFVMVAPFMISNDNPLHGISDVFNAVFVHSNMLGDSMYYGRGAGKLPTASAVVSDVVDCARHQGKTVMCLWDEEEVKPLDYTLAVRKFFVRVDGNALSEAQARELFGEIEVIRLEEKPQEYGFVTPLMQEKEFERISSGVEGILGRIRLED